MINEDKEKFDRNKLKGFLFESSVRKLLESNLNINKKIISNVVIWDITNNENTEIDIILITYSGIYVIECKNWFGTIYGDFNGNIWTQYIYGKNKQTKVNINPINQNRYHIDFLSKYLNLDKSYFKSYIVFPDQSDLKYLNAKNDISEENIKILNYSELFESIISDLKKSSICLTYEEIDKISIDICYIDKDKIKKE